MSKMASAVRTKMSTSAPDLKRHHHRENAIKKASYYVWFLGAKECRGLSGDEYVHPVVRHLVETENSHETLKVTLQVSSRGVKMIYNNSSQVGAKNGSKSSAKETEQPFKHFVPDNNICYVTQELSPNDDIVACIVMLPVSKYPLLVHVYRCDSVGTATVLRHHLQSLVERPENQKKMAELELQHRHVSQPPKRVQSQADKSLVIKQLPRTPIGGSPVTEEPESSRGSSGSDNYMLDERVSLLQESLTAELREKLNNRKNDGPILLPPKDYDTLVRMREAAKRPTIGSTRLVNGRRNTERDSSGKSSGIGSDEAPSSPTHERGGNGTFSSPNHGSQPSRNHRQNHEYSSEEDECWHTDEEGLIAAVKRPTFSSGGEPKRSPSPQPLVLNMDPSTDRKTDGRMWPPPPAASRRARVPISPSRSFDDQLTRHPVRRNGSVSAREDARYHELPDEMRYPGLDRDTAARLPHTSANGAAEVKKSPGVSRDYDWDRQLRYYVPSDRSPTGEEPPRTRSYQHPSMKRSNRPSPQVNEEERRFYRYSSPDMEATVSHRY